MNLSNRWSMMLGCVQILGTNPDHWTKQAVKDWCCRLVNVNIACRVRFAEPRTTECKNVNLPYGYFMFEIWASYWHY